MRLSYVLGRLGCGLLLGACVAVAGCAEEEDIDGVGVARESLAPVVDAECDWAFSCCVAGELSVAIGPFVTDANDCSARVLDVLEAGNPVPVPSQGGSPAGFLVYLAHGLNLERVEVKQDVVTACADWLAAQPCVEPPPEEAPEHCTPGEAAEENPCEGEDMFVGKQGPGDACNPTLDIECKEGLRCINFGTDGVCAELSAEGEHCFADLDCADPFICDYGSGLCGPGAALGGACAFIDPENPDPGTESTRCASDLTCNPDTQTCVESTCAPGSLCIADFDCPEEYVCTIGRCRQPGGAGARCEEPGDCASGVCDPIAQACGALVPNGEFCNTHDECESDYCDFFNTSTCAPQLGVGDMCVGIDEQCAGGYCDQNLLTCAAYSAEGGMCIFGNECDPELDLVCSGGGTCQKIPFANGLPCGGDFQCESQVCWMGVCDVGTPEGGFCSFDFMNKPCDIGLFCEIADEVAQTGACRVLGRAGDPCETDMQCWGGCSIAYGERVCDATPAVGEAWCDGA